MTQSLIDRLGISGRNTAMPLATTSHQNNFKSSRVATGGAKKPFDLGAVVRGYDNAIRNKSSHKRAVSAHSAKV